MYPCWMAMPTRALVMNLEQEWTGKALVSSYPFFFPLGLRRSSLIGGTVPRQAEDRRHVIQGHRGQGAVLRLPGVQLLPRLGPQGR